MSDSDRKKHTADTAKMLFGGYSGQVPYQLWKSFDPQLAKNMSLFITGDMYGHGKLEPATRQLVAISALAALGHLDELRLHAYAGLKVGLSASDIAQAIFQVGTYAGVPRVNGALGVLKEVLEERGEWPVE